jgi:hypothetical protein
MTKLKSYYIIRVRQNQEFEHLEAFMLRLYTVQSDELCTVQSKPIA